MQITITRSKKADKKYDAIIDDKKTISFGAKGYSDFTQHKDKDRKDLYIKRHKTNEDWTDPKTAGFYAKNILWNLPTIKESIADINKRFKTLNVKLK